MNLKLKNEFYSFVSNGLHFCWNGLQELWHIDHKDYVLKVTKRKHKDYDYKIKLSKDEREWMWEVDGAFGVFDVTVDEYLDKHFSNCSKVYVSLYE